MRAAIASIFGQAFSDLPQTLRTYAPEAAEHLLGTKELLRRRIAGSLAAAAHVCVFSALLTWIQGFGWAGTAAAPSGALLIIVQGEHGLTHTYLSPEFTGGAFRNGPIVLAVFGRFAWPIHFLPDACINGAQRKNRMTLLTGTNGRTGPIQLQGLADDVGASLPAVEARAKRGRAPHGGNAPEIEGAMEL